MSNSPENIRGNLMQLRGKSAGHITHALKGMSGHADGSMADGLIAFFDFLQKDKQASVSFAQKTYGAGGFALGVISTIFAVTSIYVYNKKLNKNTPHEESLDVDQILTDEVTLAIKEDPAQDIPD